jgi:hypothetical protein
MFDRNIRRIHDLSARRERHFVVAGLSALGASLASLGAAAGIGGTAAGSALATGLAATGAAAAAAGTGYAIASGERGAKMQRQAMNQQKQAQDAAAAQARSQQRRSQQAMAAANRAEPAVADIMGRAAAEMGGGPSSTMLTGPMGVNPQDLQLGRTSLLGG